MSRAAFVALEPIVRVAKVSRLSTLASGSSLAIRINYDSLLGNGSGPCSIVGRAALGPSTAADLSDNRSVGLMMRREQVIATLRKHEAELKAAGIIRLAVFGSVARGDNSPQSDVDLLADFDKTRHFTLLTMGRIESRLADLLGTRVDLSSPEWLKGSIRDQVLREAVDAF